MTPGSPQNQPNVVFILSDDQGPWAAGCYGNDEIRTPNIDRLAREGMRFENAFCTSPVCSPSRASYLTGKLPSQHGVHDYIRRGNVAAGKGYREEAQESSWPAIPYLEEFDTYTDILSENGYDCGLSGKWHLGQSETPQHGFDHWFVHQKGGGPYYGAPVIREGNHVNESSYITDAFTDEALNFIEAMNDPFYLGVHYTAPHAPWTKSGLAKNQHPEEITELYDDCPFKSCPQEAMHPDAIELTERCMGDRESLKGYFAAITAMDRQIGRILDKLDEIGIRDETLVIFTSDNGFSCGQNGFWGKGNGTYPFNMYENSVKVPFIASHPARIPRGEVSEELISGYDLMPTLLDYLGLPMPNDGPYPGTSQVSVLEGEDQSVRHQIVVHSEYGNSRMIRTGKWKYVHRYPDGPHQLFNLEEDPEERTNLLRENKNIEMANRLRKELINWFAEYVVPERDGTRFPVTGGGQQTRISEENPGETSFR